MKNAHGRWDPTGASEFTALDGTLKVDYDWFRHEVKPMTRDFTRNFRWLRNSEIGFTRKNPCFACNNCIYCNMWNIWNIPDSIHINPSLAVTMGWPSATCSTHPQRPGDTTGQLEQCLGNAATLWKSILASKLGSLSVQCSVSCLLLYEARTIAYKWACSEKVKVAGRKQAYIQSCPICLRFARQPPFRFEI